MSIRSTILCILAFIAAVCITVLVLVSEKVIMGGYEQLENRKVQLSVQRVQNALTRESERVMTQLRDWAWWGETLDFVTGKDDGYPESNLMDDTFRNLQLSVMLFFDAQGGLVHGKRFDLVRDASVPLSAEFLSVFGPESPWVRSADPHERRSGLVRMPDGILWLWSMPVLNDEGEAPAGGALVMGRYLDHALVKKIADITLQQWEYLPPGQLPRGGEPARALAALEGGQGIVSFAVDGDRIDGYALLRDVDRTPVALVRVPVSRDIMAQGRSTRNLNLAFMLVAFLFVGLALYLLMDRGLLVHVESLDRQVQGIDGRHGLGRRVEVRGRGEVARLARTINSMLDALEEVTRELEHNRHRLSLAFEAANEGLWDCDLETRNMYLSPRAYAMLGSAPDEEAMTLDACLALVHPEDAQRVRASFLDGVERSKDFHAKFRLRVKDGSWLWVEARGRGVEWDGAGRALRMIGTAQDITTRHRAEVALRESQEQYRGVMNNSPTGMHIYEVRGGELFLQEVNPAAHRLLDTNGDIVGMPLLEAFPVLRSTHYPDLYLGLAEGGEPHIFKYVLKRDGMMRKVFSMTAFHLSAGRMAVFFRDITEQYLAEEALRRSEEKFANLFRLSPDVILVTDMETGVIEDANAAFLDLAGCPLEEVQGRTLDELGITMDPPLREKFKEQVRRVGHAENYEGEFRSAGVSFGLFAMSGVAVDIGGKAFLATVARNITAMKKMQKIMVHSEKMFSVAGMAAGIAHEINNPLGIVLQASQNLLKRTDPNFHKNRKVAEELGLDLERLGEYVRVRKLDQFIDDIQKAAVRASVIIRHMLDFSRHSESGHTPCDMGSIIEGAVALANSDFDLKKNYDFKSMTLNVSVEEGLPPVECSATEIEQVLLNLLRNAAQAMAGADPPIQAPRIDIRVSRHDSWVRVEVRDNGPGMSEDLQRRVMEPFFTTKPPGVGTGLGLSVSYFIITSGHGGRFSLSSSPGQGACFTIDLPLGTDAEQG
ncbi:CHASE4 domain-containing protein [Desulfocurvus sp. DL9XJH121]